MHTPKTEENVEECSLVPNASASRLDSTNQPHRTSNKSGSLRMPSGTNEIGKVCVLENITWSQYVQGVGLAQPVVGVVSS